MVFYSDRWMKWMKFQPPSLSVFLQLPVWSEDLVLAAQGMLQTPKKTTSCDSFLVNYISLQQIILLQAVDKFQVYLSHLDSTNTFWYDYDPNQ